METGKFRSIEELTDHLSEMIKKKMKKVCPYKTIFLLDMSFLMWSFYGVPALPTQVSGLITSTNGTAARRKSETVEDVLG